jgi:hypothetical protein
MAKSQKVMQIHPLCRMFGQIAPMPKSELDEMREDIKQNGIKVPILVTKDRSTILDGATRWKLAYEADVEVPDDKFEIFDGTEEQIANEIMSRNLFRRHMSDDQRVAIVSKMRGPALEKDAKERQSKAGTFKGKAKLDGKGSVAAQVAKTAGVSQRKGEQAEKVRKSGGLEDVISGKSKLGKAASKTPTKKKPRKTEVPWEDQVYKKWTQWINRFAPPQRRRVMDLVKGWIGGDKPQAK